MTDAEQWEGEVVLLPVPLRYVHEIARYKAALIARDSPRRDQHGDIDGDQTVAVEGQGLWSAGMIAKLADSTSYGAVLTLLDRCAGAPGTWIAKSEIEESGGLDPIQLRNELGAFSKKSKKLFGQAIWPMEWKKERGAYSYRLHPVVAGWWLEARTEGEDSR